MLKNSTLKHSGFYLTSRRKFDHSNQAGMADILRYCRSLLPFHKVLVVNSESYFPAIARELTGP